MALLGDCEKAAKAMETEDWLGLKNAIHSIKGASAYAGAGRLSNVCLRMQNCYENGKTGEMISLYPEFIERVLEFRVYHRKYIAEFRGEVFSSSPDFECCAIAQGYKI
jgi:HPt (histidine-containing phosphotransfer) domain-containing protein